MQRSLQTILLSLPPLSRKRFFAESFLPSSLAVIPTMSGEGETERRGEEEESKTGLVRPPHTMLHLPIKQRVRAQCLFDLGNVYYVTIGFNSMQQQHNGIKRVRQSAALSLPPLFVGPITLLLYRGGRALFSCS